MKKLQWKRIVSGVFAVTMLLYSFEFTGTENFISKVSAVENENADPEDSTNIVTSEDSDDYSKFGKLCINEVCASNDSCLSTTDGKYHDWVELYNGSSSVLDISGVGLSKKKDVPYQLRFPEGTVIEPGGYLIVYCNKKMDSGLTDGLLYASFNIGVDGETLYLSEPATIDEDGNDENGKFIEVLDVPFLKTDDVFGRTQDGDGELSVLTPTPGESNNNAARISYVDAPAFSQES